MFLFTHDRNCVHDFEFNLIESYDTIEKINNKEDNIYVHIKTYEEKICNENSKKKKFKKKVYLLGLNYNEYIFLRGNFRFRLIKGLIKFNGEILKPSKEYINVRIPVFYPLFKLIALNVNKIKYMDNKFVYNEGASNKYDNKKKFIGDKNISRTINNKKLKTNNLEDLKNEVDINVLTKNREERNNMNCIISSNENEFLCEYADTIIKNYLYGLNLLPDKNVKKKNFYEYMLFSNKEDISLFSSSFMIDSIKSKPHFENYPIIIAFHRKKDFLYYLYNNNTSKKLNISNYRQHNSCYIDTFQFSYILKEFLLYMYNNKNYDLEKVAKKVEEINSNYISCDNNNNDNNMLNSDISNTNNSSSNNNIINKNNDNVENLVQTISGNEKYKVEKSTDNFTKEESHLNKKEYLESFIKNIGKTNISENYYDYEEKCSSSHNIFSVIIMGDKNKGKSFLVINFINNLLNYYKSVILVDVDIGQPIIGTSGFLSIYKIKYSLNNYNFFEKKNKCIKKIFYGCCSLNNNVHFYITCLKNIYNYLFFEYLKKKKKKKNICNYPLVINTFGWIRNIGLFLLHVNIF